MRKIDKIVVHCSATKAGMPYTAADVDRWHKSRGWFCIGYHFVIDLDGTVELGRPVSQVGAHAYGHNRNTIAVCYIGGLDENGRPADTRTLEQRKSMLKLISELVASHRCDVVGHRDLSPDVNGDGIIQPWEWLKYCPCFDAHAEYGYLYNRLK